MDRLTASSPRPKAAARPEPHLPSLQDDPHWELAQRVVAGPHFARSPLLSKFLLFVVAETLEGRGDEITEHQIGVQVFDRPADYRTLEDNIVRNYARQLRKRLAEHFADQGSAEPVRIDIPLGGYVPVFFPAGEEHPLKHLRPAAGPGACARRRRRAGARKRRPRRPRRKWPGRLAAVVLAAVYSAALVGRTWYAATRARAPQPAPPQEPAHALWAALLAGRRTATSCLRMRDSICLKIFRAGPCRWRNTSQAATRSCRWAAWMRTAPRICARSN